MAAGKGIIDIEFMLSVFVFVSVTIFVFFMIVGNVPVFHRESLNENLRAHAFQVSQLLIFDEGEPPGWAVADVKRVGLSTGEAYEISAAKIANLATLCADYSRLKSFLVQDFRYDIRISIMDESGSPLLNCGPSATTTVLPEFLVTRYAVLETGTIVRLQVSIL